MTADPPREDRGERAEDAPEGDLPRPDLPVPDPRDSGLRDSGLHDSGGPDPDLPVSDPSARLSGGSARLAADRRMLESLVCPVTQSALDYDREAGELISPKAHLAFPIRDGIPIMIVSEARRLED